MLVLVPDTAEYGVILIAQVCGQQLAIQDGAGPEIVILNEHRLGFGEVVLAVCRVDGGGEEQAKVITELLVEKNRSAGQRLFEQIVIGCPHGSGHI